MQQLRYCLCMVCRAVSTALANNPSQAFSISLRRSLFDTFGSWCEEGFMPGRYRADVAKAVNISRMRIKDPETARQAEFELAEASDVVEHAAYLAMAAMLLVCPSHPCTTVCSVKVRCHRCIAACTTDHHMLPSCCTVLPAVPAGCAHHVPSSHAW